MYLYTITDTYTSILESSGHLYIFSHTPVLLHRWMLTWTRTPSHMWVFICTHVSVLTASADAPERMGTLCTDSYISVHLCACARLHTHSCTLALGHILTLHRPKCNSCPFTLGGSRPGGQYLNCVYALWKPWGFQDGRPQGAESRRQPAWPLTKIIWKCGGWVSDLCRQNCFWKKMHLLFAHLTNESGYLNVFCGPGSAVSFLCEPK